MAFTSSNKGITVRKSHRGSIPAVRSLFIPRTSIFSRNSSTRSNNAEASCRLARILSTKEATLTGFEPTLKFSRLCAIPPQTCARLRVRGENANQPVCTNRAELRSSSVRICPKTIGRFYGACFGKPSQRARGFGKDVVRDKNIVVGVLAVPAVLRKGSPTTWSTRACGSSSTTRKACSTCRAMSPCTRRTPPWNCCTPLLHLAKFTS